MSIHPTAIISDNAVIDPSAQIGPYVVIRGQVEIGADVQVDQFATIGAANTQVKIGKGSRIFPGAVVGEEPQDLKYKGEPTSLIVGNNTMIREYVTMHVGTPDGGGITRVGDHCLIMAYVHIAHDCLIGNHVVIANSTQLAGHVEMEDHVKVGGVCAFNQFVRLGKYCYIAGDSSVNKDVLPFAIAQGKYAVMRAANQVGMDRSGFSKTDIEQVRRALRIITKGGHTLEEALTRIEQECDSQLGSVKSLLDFARRSERGLAL
jgi:UDP-N-acetylglucosamine acyltransferase